MGANPNILNDSYELPIKTCIMNENYLVANEIMKQKTTNLNVTGEYEMAILHDAVVYDCRVDFIKELVRHGSNINLVDEMGDTPLHIAVESDNLSAIRVLLDLGADTSIKNRNGRTPRELAYLKNEKEVINLFEIKKMKA